MILSKGDCVVSVWGFCGHILRSWSWVVLCFSSGSTCGVSRLRLFLAVRSTKSSKHLLARRAFEKWLIYEKVCNNLVRLGWWENLLTVKFWSQTLQQLVNDFDTRQSQVDIFVQFDQVPRWLTVFSNGLHLSNLSCWAVCSSTTLSLPSYHPPLSLICPPRFPSIAVI